MRLRVPALLLGLLAAAPLSAQKRAQTLDDVSRLFVSGAQPARILEVLKLDCIDFPVDERAIARLQAYNATPEFIQALNGVCYVGSQVEVVTDPPNQEAQLGNAPAARTPALFKVQPGKGYPLLVGNAKVSRSTTVDVPPGTLVRVAIAMPKDTAPWPVMRTPSAVVRDLGLETRYPPVEEDPAPPVAPSGGSAFGRFSIGGLLLGGAAFAATSSVCNQTVNGGASGGYLSNGTYVGPNQTASLGASTGCVGAAVAAGAVVGGFANAWLGSTRDKGAKRAYEREVAARPKLLADLKAKRQLRERAIAENAQVTAMLKTEQENLDVVKAKNAAVVRYNDGLPEPTLAMTLLDSSKAPAYAQAVAAAGLGGPPAGASGAGAPAKEAPLTDPVDVKVPKATKLNEKAVAVVIGNRDYKKKDIPGVDYALNDARTMKKYLVETFGFREENILYEENASYADMQTIFGRPGDERGKLFNYVAADSTSDVFIFYSGHGAPDPTSSKAYLVPVDADPQLIQLTGYPVSSLYENLAKIPAKSLTVFLDACFSGSSDKGMLLKGVSPALLRVETPILSAPNAVVLSASAANQVSGWYEEKKHGLFSYFLFKGLQGEADKSQAGVVTAEGLAEYVKDNVVRLSRRLKGREQTPQLVTNAPDRVITPVLPQ